MTARKQYSTIKSKSKTRHYTVFVIIVIIAVSLISAFFLIFLTQGITNFSDNSEVGVTVSVSGNDIVVEIIDKGRADKLIGVSISLADSELSEEDEYMEYSSDRIVFKNACINVGGDKHIFVFGYFADGKRKTLLSTVLKI